MSADKRHLDYMSSRKLGAVYVRKNYPVDDFPKDIENKVYLLKHFERYILERLYGDYDYAFEDLERTKGMHFVQKYLRMKHVIVFKMSHNVLQFNFYDHSKVILSSDGLLITHIDKNYKMTRWALSDVIARSLSPSEDAADAKQNQKLCDKLWYCREVLESIRLNGTSSTATSGHTTSTLNGGASTGITLGASKMSLR